MRRIGKVREFSGENQGGNLGTPFDKDDFRAKAESFLGDHLPRSRSGERRTAQPGGKATSPPLNTSDTMNATLTRWNPVRELEDFQNRILSAFRPVTGRHQEGPDSLSSAEWAPSVNISENEKEYSISAEIPGVKPEDVKVTVENGTLTITGERRYEKEDKNLRHHLIERAYGRFMRSFSLPGDSDTSSVEASFKDGLLSIKVAKSEQARPKQIEIKAAA